MDAFIEDDINNPHISMLVSVDPSSSFDDPSVIPNFFCKCKKTFPRIAESGSARSENPLLTYSCMCLHFASVSRCMFSESLRFSFPVSRNLHFECIPVASSAGHGLVFAICFQTRI